MSPNSYKTDILITLRHPAARFPVLAALANCLVEQGFNMQILAGTPDPGDNPSSSPFDSRISHQYIAKARDLNAPSPSKLASWRDYFSFAASIRRTMREAKPKTVICWDIDSLAAVGFPTRPADSKLIAYYGELVLRDDCRGNPLATLRLDVATRTAQQADLVVFPDPFRAAIFQAVTRLREPPLVVPNCPRRLEKVQPDWNWRKQVLGEKADSLKMVLFQGSVDPTRKLMTVVRSMPHWPANSALVCRGMLIRAMVEQIMREATELGVADRIRLVSSPSYTANALSMTATADVGIALFETRGTLNIRYSAFAGQKQHEYMAVGVPVVANHGPGFDELVEYTGAGLCADPDSPAEVGYAINRLLTDEPLRRQCALNARRFHLEHMNFDTKFQPVLAHLREYTGHDSVGQ